MTITNCRLAPYSAFKMLRISMWPSLQRLTTKDGGNADFAGAYICLAANSLKTKQEAANVLNYLWFVNSHIN